MRSKRTGKNIYVQFFKTVATNVQLCKQHRIIIVISLYPASHSQSNISGRSLVYAPSALCTRCHSQSKSQRVSTSIVHPSTSVANWRAAITRIWIFRAPTSKWPGHQWMLSTHLQLLLIYFNFVFHLFAFCFSEYYNIIIVIMCDVRGASALATLKCVCARAMERWLCRFDRNSILFYIFGWPRSVAVATLVMDIHFSGVFHHWEACDASHRAAPTIGRKIKEGIEWNRFIDATQHT